MTKVLGVDPGLGATGFSLLKQAKKKTSLIAYGLIKPPIKSTIERRLSYLFIEMSKVIDKFTPSTLAIEDAFYSKNVKSAMRLGQARGVIILAAAQANIDVFEYAPRKVNQPYVEMVLRQKNNSIYGDEHFKSQKKTKVS